MTRAAQVNLDSTMQTEKNDIHRSDQETSNIDNRNEFSCSAADWTFLFSIGIARHMRATDLHEYTIQNQGAEVIVFSPSSTLFR